MISLFADGRSRLFVALVANGLGQAASAISAALVVEFAFSRLGSPVPATTPQIVSVALALAVAAAFIAWLRARERIDAERLGQSYSHDLRMALFAHLTSMSPRSVGAGSRGSTVLRFIGDLSAVRKWVSLGLARLCVAGTMVVVTLIALAFIDPTLAASTGAAALCGGLGAIAQGPKLREATRLARRRRSRLAGHVTESIGAVGVVQANNAVDRERRRVAKHSRRTRNAMVERSRRLGRLQAVAEATGSGATAMLLLAALVFGIEAPQVAAGMTVVGLLVPQLRGLARVQEYRQQYRVAIEAIERFTARPPQLSEADEPAVLASGPGELELRSASLGPVRDVTACARAGRTIAVVGSNGSGKSTLFSMIGRLVDLDGGQIVLDGSDLATVSLSDAHAAIGMAGPDLPLMKGSIHRNLTYHYREASDDEVDWVIELCSLRALLAELPEGLQTRVDEGGANLSSGQRQRILLARAVLARPRLLLLDEADANLDAATAGVLDAVLEAHVGTALVITHRRDRAERADEIWHLADGRLIEVGFPGDLLQPGRASDRLFAAGSVVPRDDGMPVSFDHRVASPQEIAP